MNIKISAHAGTPDHESAGNIAVVYARYSSHNQTEQSIEGQLAAAHAYAEVKGYTIVHEYVDRAKTGRNDNRDEFQQMLSDCGKKKFQIIIVWKVDRFGRNREEITFNKYRAKKHGVRVEYVAENLPETPEAVILESVLEGMAEYYSLQLSQNVQRGLQENFKKGKVIGGRLPLGYRISAQKGFEIDPDTAPIVQMIFDRYLEGGTCEEIATELNAKGIRSSQGGSFTKNSLRTLLSNEKYIGRYTYKRLGETIDGAIPPIIDKAKFDKVQRLMVTNRRAPSRTWSRTEYLLTDKLFCGNCGSPMAGESGKGRHGIKYQYYLCGSHKRKLGCNRHAIKQDFLEDFVLRFTLDLLTDDDLLMEIVNRTWAYYEAKGLDMSRQKALQNQLSSVNTAIKNLLRAIEAGFFSEATRIRMEELEGQKTALEGSLAELELAPGNITKERIEFFLFNLRTMDYTDRECQKRLIAIFINSIYVYDDYLILNYNYTSDSRLIRFEEMAQLLSSETGEWFESRALISALTRTLEPFNVKWFECVFSINVKPRKKPW